MGSHFHFKIDGQSQWMTTQSGGEYVKALQNYYEAMHLEIDPYDQSYIPYNIGLIYTSNGEHAKALEYYFQALKRIHPCHKLLVILL